MNEPMDKKNEFIAKSAEELMERFIVCYNGVTRQYKSSDLLITDEVAPALLHTATMAAFNFLTYLGAHYSISGQEEIFFDDFQKNLKEHCDMVLEQIAKHREEENNSIIITDEDIIND
jgi:hypothetical protein